MASNMALLTQQFFGKIIADNTVILWKQMLIWQRLMTIQMKPLTEDQALHLGMRISNVEKRTDTLDKEVFGIYL